MRFILIFLFYCMSVSGFAEVFVMPMDNPLPDDKKVAQSVLVKPSQDDEMLSSRTINEFIRYKICGTKITDIIWENAKPAENKNTQNKNKENVVSNEENTLWDRYSQTVCGVYYASSGAAGKGLAVNAAIKDLGDVTDLTIKETTVIKTNKNDFNIKEKTPIAVKSFESSGVYKKVLTSPKKIRLLYNYADLPLAWRINDLMDKRGNTALPVRITFYEDASAENPPAYAVVIFKAAINSFADTYSGSADLVGDETTKIYSAANSEELTRKDKKSPKKTDVKNSNKNTKSKSGVTIVPLKEEKYLIPLTDTLPVSSDIYEIKPDYAYFYR